MWSQIYLSSNCTRSHTPSSNTPKSETLVTGTVCQTPYKDEYIWRIHFFEVATEELNASQGQQGLEIPNGRSELYQLPELYAFNQSDGNYHPSWAQHR